ncbi:membrane protein [Bacillus sp. FJAT-27231]|uniref:permease n=1 Tax=Bacillus sp. FJAT-27231 TaxID=1679168 RepID=UPI0006715938|nr:permease [Bacillus sp. FJAT-27231]KMY52934.1 membrane protein [Bacillus sp. FJAT-27231]
MVQLDTTPQPKQATHKRTFWFVAAFILIAAAGLFYIKWWPYYNKSILAANTHSIGDSILGDLSSETPSWQSAWDYALAYFSSVWKAAVLGILLGSLLQVLLPAQWLLRLLGKASFGSTMIAGMAAVPGMMCSCCAAPIAIGLRKKNVSVGAALAFWIGNPMMNPATLIFMTFVLSWKFTLMRLVFGFILTFGISYWANRLAKDVQPVDVDQVIVETQQEGKFLRRWLGSIGRMLLYIVPAYVLSVLLLGAARVWLFPQLSESVANSLLAIIIFAVAGMLFVIPTAAEIPIIQTLMSLGLGAGPAAALLITLPAISLPSLLMVAKSFPKKVLFFVMASVVVLGVIGGLIGRMIL